MKVRDFTCFRDPAEDLVRGTVCRSRPLAVPFLYSVTQADQAERSLAGKYGITRIGQARRVGPLFEGMMI